MQSVGEARRDPRVARSKALVLETAVELLAEHGYAGATIQGISDRSGVAKTTIYRHWPSRAALLAEAFVALLNTPAPPDTGELRADLLTLLSRLARGLQHARWAALLPALVDAAERDPELGRLARQFSVDRRQTLRRVLDAGAARGEIPPGADTELAVHMLVGPLFYRRLLSHEPIPERFVQRLVDGVLAAIGD